MSRLEQASVVIMNGRETCHANEWSQPSRHEAVERARFQKHSLSFESVGGFTLFVITETRTWTREIEFAVTFLDRGLPGRKSERKNDVRITFISGACVTFQTRRDPQTPDGVLHKFCAPSAELRCPNLSSPVLFPPSQLCHFKSL